MSTQGSAAVGLVVASPVLLVLGAGVGLGILIGRGVMFCGEQLENNYNAKCAEATGKAEVMREWSRTHTDVMRSSFASRVESLAVAHAYQTAEQQPGMSEAQQEALRQAIAQARAAIADASGSVFSPQDLEKESVALRLRITIESNRTVLSSKLIKRAERALEDNVEGMREAISTLEDARRNIEASHMQQARRQQQIQHTLHVVTAQLNIIDEMLRDAARSQETEFVERRRTIEALVATANTNLEANPDEALRFATEAERVVRAFSERVSAYLLDAWDHIHSQVNTQLGMIGTLKKMVEEAGAIKIAEAELLDDLTQRISTAYNEAQLIGQSSSLNVQHRLTVLANRIELLKHDIFALVGTYQQRSIAETIAATLTDLGFQSVHDDQPMLQENGDAMRVAVTRAGKTLDGGRDDKLISFDVSRRGDVSYDFSGYTGESCVEEAEKIFAALRVRGVFLLNPETANELQENYPEGVTARELNRTRFHLHAEKNKTQAELAERIHAVLERMHYRNIRQSAVGGCIELDAFNGSIGYHVILDPEGSMQVFKDTEQLDASMDRYDPVVAEAQQVVEEQEVQEQHKGTSQRKQQKYVDRRSKRTLEN